MLVGNTALKKIEKDFFLFFFCKLCVRTRSYPQRCDAQGIVQNETCAKETDCYLVPIKKAVTIYSGVLYIYTPLGWECRGRISEYW